MEDHPAREPAISLSEIIVVHVDYTRVLDPVAGHGDHRQGQDRNGPPRCLCQGHDVAIPVEQRHRVTQRKEVVPATDARDVEPQLARVEEGVERLDRFGLVEDPEQIGNLCAGHLDLTCRQNERNEAENCQHQEKAGALDVDHRDLRVA